MQTATVPGFKILRRMGILNWTVLIGARQAKGLAAWRPHRHGSDDVYQERRSRPHEEATNDGKARCRTKATSNFRQRGSRWQARMKR